MNKSVIILISLLVLLAVSETKPQNGFFDKSLDEDLIENCENCIIEEIGSGKNNTNEIFYDA